MSSLARDIMERHVISVTPAASLLEVQRLFTEEEISGAPVVDSDGGLVGVITNSDVMRALEQEHDTGVVETDYFRDLLPYSSPDWSTVDKDLQDRLSDLRVEDAMTPGVISVGADASAGKVARVLRENHIHRVFVVEGSLLLGVISAFDLLQLLEE